MQHLSPMGRSANMLQQTLQWRCMESRLQSLRCCLTAACGHQSNDRSCGQNHKVSKTSSPTDMAGKSDPCVGLVQSGAGKTHHHINHNMERCHQ
jgi:hypothetical protein